MAVTVPVPAGHQHSLMIIMPSHVKILLAASKEMIVLMTISIAVALVIHLCLKRLHQTTSLADLGH